MWRSLGMLRAVRGLIVVSLLLGVVASALPYISAAAFGPMAQVIADAGERGNLSGVWDMQGPLVAREDGLLRSLAGPVPFAVLLAVWAGSLVLNQLMYFVDAWVGAKVQRLLLVDIRQRVHDHVQSLSLDFFTGSRTGELIQRVTVEPAGVQRLLTDCLLPPLIDAVVLVVVIAYLLAISWQMTVAALVLTPLALITLRYRGPRRSGGDATGDDSRSRDGRRARADGERDRRDPDVQRAAGAQQAISQGIRRGRE